MDRTDIIKADPEIEHAESVDDVYGDDIQPQKLDHERYADLNHADLQREIDSRDEQEIEYMNNESWWDKFMFTKLPLRVKNANQLVIVLGVFAAFSGILSGLDQSIISGAQPGIKNSFHPDTNEMSLITSLMPLGAMAGSIMMTLLNHYFGRRNSIIISCLWYTLGAGLCAGARSIHMLYAGRFIIGIGVGIEGGCVGIYIAESVPPSLRGNLVSIYQLMIAFGEVVGYADGGVFIGIRSGNWRYMLGSSVVFSTALLIGMLFLPESPRWLVSKGKSGRAWHVWKQLRDINEPKNLIEFLDMEMNAKMETERAAGEAAWTRYFELFTHARNRRAFIYSFIMIFLGQMTGVNAILYNMSGLLIRINFDDRKSVLMSMVGGGALFFGTVPAVLYMDRFGRRTWAQNIVMFLVGLVLVGVGYLYTNKDQAYFDAHRATALGLFFSGIILYMGFFGAYACLTWVVPSESFDLRTRAQGMSICSAALYFWSWLVTYFFADMVRAMTYTGLTIGFFGGLAVLGFFYQLFFMPETKDKTLEEIDDIFNKHTHEIIAENMRRLGARWGWLFGKRRHPDADQYTNGSDAEKAPSTFTSHESIVSIPKASS